MGLMKIILAETAGFCMGVKRAVDLSLEHATRSSGKVYTIGPLIHNTQTVEMLKERGVVTFDESEQVNPGSTVLVRAHGIPLEVQNSYKEKGFSIVDGTCPKVKNVHRVIEKYRKMGFTIVITGDKGHAEVIGLQGYAGDTGRLISSPADVDDLPHLDRICLVSQTTFDKNIFDEIAGKIRKKFATSEVVIKKTICSATDQRQNETRELAGRVDTMIVVGGKHSANTMRLERIASEVKPGRVQHVETETEINWNALADCKTVGITAGASTPNWMIKRVVEYIQLLDNTKKKDVPGSIKAMFNIFSNLNVFVAVGAVALYITSCILQRISPAIAGMLLLFLYFFSMYLWNSLASIENTRHLSLSRYKFYNENKKILYTVAALTIVILLVISLVQNKFLFYLMLFSVIAGSIYHINIFPPFLISIIRSKSLKDIPASRDLFVALAWGILLTFIPQITRGRLYFGLSTWLCFSLFFIQSFLRSLIFDLRDIEGDRIMGRETLVTIIGENRVKKAIQAILIISITTLISYPVIFCNLWGNVINLDLDRAAFAGQAASFLYVLCFMAWNKNNRASRSFFFNFIADAQFYISGLCAWLLSAAFK
ncbi:MAG TPA: 4-hydroxy-3-methylbut-2-enyl diphosphate reductase [Fibrobacteres bacterium]|nr:4-hydroxy-3-methylbut-2-enyl diphosphate reductase [Fibrobacterota bacterium]